MNKTDKDNLFGYYVRLYQLSEEDGGGWAAEAPDLKGCFSDGESPEEAINNLRDAMLGWFQIAKEDGKPIPKPTNFSEDVYSGKFTVRVPKSIHRLLAERSEQEGVSLNQYINSVLAFGLGCFEDNEKASSYIDHDESQVANDEVIVEWKQTFSFKNPKKYEANDYLIKDLIGTLGMGVNNQPMGRLRQ